MSKHKAMQRGPDPGGNKDAGDEWEVAHVASGASPDDWDFYYPKAIPQNVPECECTGDALDAFFTQPRRRG